MGSSFANFCKKKSGEVLIDDDVFENIAKIIEKEGSDCWFSDDPQKFLGKKYKSDNYEKSKDIVSISGAITSKEREIPEYIQMDEKNKKAKLSRVPKFAEIPYPTIMSPSLVIEYYSR